MIFEGKKILKVVDSYDGAELGILICNSYRSSDDIQEFIGELRKKGEYTYNDIIDEILLEFGGTYIPTQDLSEIEL